MQIPRLVISGLSGGAGKTMLSLGLARALSRAGLAVRAFKKGPDYIDAAWLALAAHAPQANLDPFFTPAKRLQELFTAAAKGFDLALVEGNRGLFDGLDLDGSCSTSEVARLLGAPILLIIDCTKMTRTTAALVKGCLDFEPGLRLGGVVLNRVGNKRHQALATRAVEELAEVPVLGALPRLAKPFIFERHMGLSGTAEHAGAKDQEQQGANALLDELASFIADHVDVNRVLKLAESAAYMPMVTSSPPAQKTGSPVCCIGYVHDDAFWFYYRENLEALENAGAKLVPLSLLSDSPWPDIDGLYIGGGLPELYAERISANRKILDRLACLADAGLPLYAECGGFMVLCRSLIVDGRNYPMAGIFNCSVEFCDRPQGLGYVEARCLIDTPYFPAGCRFKGHEFHFSRCLAADELSSPKALALRLDRGRGMGRDSDGFWRDGLLRANTFAAYTHIYAPAVPHWAPTFVDLCRKWRNK